MLRPLALTLLCAAACGAPAADATFIVELIHAESVAQVDSVPAPRVAVREGHVHVEAHVGLGATGYALVPTGTVRDGVVDVLVTPRMPEGMAGLTVLTRYAYRLTTPVLAPGEYLIRVRHADPAGGASRLALEQRVRVD